MQEITLRLPWPPSVNQIWSSTSKGNWYSTKIAKEFKEVVHYLVFAARSPKFDDSEILSICLDAYPPDHRKRDLDNLFKVVGDALQDAKVYKNDCMIKRILMEMKEKDPSGKGFVLVNIAVIQVEGKLNV